LENTVREIIETRNPHYSLWSIDTLEKTWEEFKEYLEEKHEDVLFFERLMVFFFKQGRFLTFKE
ncbi:hypothetical protein ACR9LG_07820, partial [Helicobacter pylori]